MGRRVAIFGAGAVGGHMAVKLALAGHEVTVIARGATHEAIAASGITLRSGDAVLTTRPRAARNAQEAGRQELVIVTVKSTAIGPGFGAEIAPMLGPDSAVVFVANGMPFWYFVKSGGEPVDHPFFAAAPEIMRDLRGAAVVGGVVYSANTATAPGQIVNNSPKRNRLHYGAVSGDGHGEGLVAEVFEPAAFDAQASEDLLEDMWSKLMIAMCAPPLCISADVLPRGIAADPALRDVYARAVAEAHRIARTAGHLKGEAPDPDAMLAAMPPHTPSMVEDYLNGRPIEIEATLLAPLALARAAGLDTPVLDTLAAISVSRSVRSRAA